jgi:hypothetical protein
MTQSWSTLRASCLKSSTRFPEGSTAALSRVVLYCIMPTAATPSDVTRPTSFAKPWSVEIPMQNTNGPIDEYPCKEGNYALADILAGARAEEKSATSKQGSR